MLLKKFLFPLLLFCSSFSLSTALGSEENLKEIEKKEELSNLKRNPVENKTKIKLLKEQLETLEKERLDHVLENKKDDLSCIENGLLDLDRLKIPSLKKEIKKLQEEIDAHIQKLLQETYYYLDNGYRSQKEEENFNNAFNNLSPIGFFDLFRETGRKRARSVKEFFSKETGAILTLRNSIKFEEWKQTLQAYKEWSTPQFECGIALEKIKVYTKNKALFEVKSDLYGNIYKSFSFKKTKKEFITLAAAHLSAHVAIYIDNSVHLFDMDTRELLYTVRTNSRVRTMEWSPDDHALVIGEEDRLLIVQDPIEKPKKNDQKSFEKEVITIRTTKEDYDYGLLESPRQLKWSPNGSQLGVVCGLSPFISVVDVKKIKTDLPKNKNKLTLKRDKKTQESGYLRICKEVGKLKEPTSEDDPKNPICQIEWISNNEKEATNPYHLISYSDENMLFPEVLVWDIEKEQAIATCPVDEVELKQLLPQSNIVVGFEDRLLVAKRINFSPNSSNSKNSFGSIKKLPTINRAHNNYYSKHFTSNDARYIASYNYKDPHLRIFKEGKVYAKLPINLRQDKKVVFAPDPRSPEHKKIIIHDDIYRRSYDDEVLNEVCIYSTLLKKKDKVILPRPLQVTLWKTKDNKVGEPHFYKKTSLLEDKNLLPRTYRTSKRFPFEQVDLLATSHGSPIFTDYASETGELKIVDFKTHNILHKEKLEKNKYYALALNPKNSNVALGKDDGTILLTNLTLKKDSEIPAVLPCSLGYESKVTELSWSPDGQHLAALYEGQDTLLVLWRLATLSEKKDEEYEEEFKIDLDDEAETDVIAKSYVIEQKFSGVKRTQWTSDGKMMIVELFDKKHKQDIITFIQIQGQGKFNTYTLAGSRVHVLDDKKFLIERGDQYCTWEYKSDQGKGKLVLLNSQKSKTEKGKVFYAPSKETKVIFKDEKTIFHSTKDKEESWFIPHKLDPEEIHFSCQDDYVLFLDDNEIACYPQDVKGTLAEDFLGRKNLNPKDAREAFSECEKDKKFFLADTIPSLRLSQDDNQELCQEVQRIQGALENIILWWKRFKEKNVRLDDDQLSEEQQLENAIQKHSKECEAMYGELRMQKEKIKTLKNPYRKRNELNEKREHVLFKIQDDLEKQEQLEEILPKDQLERFVAQEEKYVRERNLKSANKEKKNFQTKESIEANQKFESIRRKRDWIIKVISNHGGPRIPSQMKRHENREDVNAFVEKWDKELVYNNNANLPPNFPKTYMQGLEKIAEKSPLQKEFSELNKKFQKPKKHFKTPEEAEAAVKNFEAKLAHYPQARYELFTFKIKGFYKILHHIEDNEKKQAFRKGKPRLENPQYLEEKLKEIEEEINKSPKKKWELTKCKIAYVEKELKNEPERLEEFKENIFKEDFYKKSEEELKKYNAKLWRATLRGLSNHLDPTSVVVKQQIKEYDIASLIYMHLHALLIKTSFSFSPLAYPLRNELKELQKTTLPKHKDLNEHQVAIQKLSRSFIQDKWEENMKDFCLPILVESQKVNGIKVEQKSIEEIGLERSTFTKRESSISPSPEVLYKKLNDDISYANFRDSAASGGDLYLVETRSEELQIINLRSGSTDARIKTTNPGDQIISVAAIPDQKLIACQTQQNKKEIILFSGDSSGDEGNAKTMSLPPLSSPITAIKGKGSQLFALDEEGRILSYKFENGAFKEGHQYTQKTSKYSSITPIDSELVLFSRTTKSKKEDRQITTHGLLNLKRSTQTLFPSAGAIAISPSQKYIVTSSKEEDQQVLQYWEYNRKSNSTLRIKRINLRDPYKEGIIRDIIWDPHKEHIFYFLIGLQEEPKKRRRKNPKKKFSYLVKYDLNNDYTQNLVTEMPYKEGSLSIHNNNRIGMANVGGRLYFFLLEPMSFSKLLIDFRIPNIVMLLILFGLLWQVKNLYQQIKQKVKKKKKSRSKKRKTKNRSRKSFRKP